MEAVSFEDFDEINEISVRNIKKACMKHYGMSETMFCDALAGEHTSKNVISNSMQVCPAESVGCWHAKIGKAHYRYHNLRWDLHFDMSVMARTGRPTTVDFSIEPEPFGIGGFRKAFKATSNDRGFNGSTWVVKRYLEKAAVDIIASHRRVGRGGREGRKFQLSMIIGFFFCMLPSASYNFNSFFGGWRNFFLVMLLLFLAPKQLAAYAPT